MRTVVWKRKDRRRGHSAVTGHFHVHEAVQKQTRKRHAALERHDAAVKEELVLQRVQIDRNNALVCTGQLRQQLRDNVGRRHHALG